MRVAVIGASGLIGSNLLARLTRHGIDATGTYFSTPREGLTRFDLARDRFQLFDNCSHVVISGAVTGIEQCFRKRELAHHINVTRTRELIDYLGDKGIRAIFLSSDQVFDGSRGGYLETDAKNPLNCYGLFKAVIEDHLASDSRHLVLRLGKTYSSSLAERSLFSEIYQRLKRGDTVSAAHDQIFNISEVQVVSRLIHRSIVSELTGLFNLAEARVMSRYQFALSIADAHGFPPRFVRAIEMASLGLPEIKGGNNSLNVEKIRIALGEPLSK
jgi:dTDP-4-dehydrorhamnose reductase